MKLEKDKGWNPEKWDKKPSGKPQKKPGKNK